MAYKLVINGEKTIGVDGGKIIASPVQAIPAINIDDAIVFPGLINSHDHLDFNLFPPLANRIYANYTEWGRDIHRQNKSSIAATLRIPLPLRIQWGWYKNLLNGFTTVVHHGNRVAADQAGISIFQDTHTLHSVHFDRYWRIRLLNPFAKKQPFVIHCGEGIDHTARQEIDRLIRANWWRRPVIGIHGVAMTVAQAQHFKALVWCPAANFFLLGQTAHVDALRKVVPVVFGTDSTLTASWDAWQQLRQARNTGLVSDEVLYNMVTTQAATVWGLTQRGTLLPGADADIVVARSQRKHTFHDSFFSVTPADIVLVIQNGIIRLYDKSLQTALADTLVQTDYDAIVADGQVKYVQKGIRQLIQTISTNHPDVKLPVK